MLVTLIVIEFTDVVFAFDSIPAIFGITTDAFIIFTSNIFAILGLRSLYFVVERLHGMFEYLNVGLACVLIFIGAKMLLDSFIHIALLLSIGIVFGIIIISIIYSIYFGKKVKAKAV